MVEVDGRWASALVLGSDAQAYQVRVPRGARSVAINTTDGPVETAAVTSSACTDATTIVSRCEWGADESLMTWGAPVFHPAQKLTVHHTASDNDATDPAATVRAIYRYQTVDRGFGDIGYHYLIDEAGLVYEGRHSGDDGDPAHDAVGNVATAAHVGGINSGNMGIALLGTLTTVEPRPRACSALEQLLTQLSTRHAIDPHGSSTYVNPVNGNTKIVANISGHRDWAATECPGGKLYALLPTIRDTVAGSGNPPPMDTTPPAITAVKASATSNSATVTWATDEHGRVPAHEDVNVDTDFCRRTAHEPLDHGRRSCSTYQKRVPRDEHRRRGQLGDEHDRFLQDTLTRRWPAPSLSGCLTAGICGYSANCQPGNWRIHMYIGLGTLLIIILLILVLT